MKTGGPADYFKPFVVLSLILGGVVYYFLSQPQTKTEKMKGSPVSAIGRVTPLGRDVRYKGSEPFWTQIQQSGPIYEQDRIFAGEDSRARLDIDSGGHFFVTPNTLVVVSRMKGESLTELSAGSLFGELLKGGRLLLKQGKRVTEFTGRGQFFLVKKDKTVQLEVLSGKIKLKENKATHEVTAEEVVVVAETRQDFQKLPSSPIELLQPLKGAHLWLKEPQEISLRWSGRDEGSYRISVAYSPDFKSGLFTASVQGTEYKLKVSPFAQYYWKVESLDPSHQDDKSRMGLFSTWKAEGPRIGTPQSNLKETELPEFRWQDLAYSRNYLLEVGRDPEFTSKILVQETHESFWRSPSALESGTYYWRVTSKREGREDFISETAVLSVSGPLPPLPVPSPALEIPKLAGFYNFELYEEANYAPENRLPDFRYVEEVSITAPPPQSLSPVKWSRYEWQLTFRQKGRVFEKVFETTEPDLAVAELQNPGVYKLKIRYQLADSRWSEWSEGAHVRVILAPPRAQVEVKNQNAVFSWKEMAKVALYEVALSDSSQKKRYQKFKASNNSMALAKLAPGTYRAHLRSLSDSEWPLSSWSKPIEFRVEAPKKPMKKDMKNEEVLPQQRRLAAKEPTHPASEDIAPEGETSVAIEEKPITPTDSASSANLRSMLSNEPKSSRHLELWTGAGANYLSFEQADSSGLESGQFAATTSPTQMVEAILKWDEKWLFNIGFHQMPGKIKSAGTQSLDRDTYTWSYLGMEAERLVLDHLWGAKIFALGGLQRHQMLFLISGYDYDVNVINTSLINASAGVKAQWRISMRWKLESFLRYQTPLVAQIGNGGSFKIQGSTSFDGLLGASRSFGDQWKVGLYWFGQSHDMKYNYVSQDSAEQRSGQQKFFNSNLQIRLGYDLF